mgnify:CR=1 FL=1
MVYLILKRKKEMRCPWGRSNVSFSNGKYSKDEKEFILWKFQNDRENFKSFIEKHDIKYSTVTTWNQIVDNGGILQNRRGRPNSIDDIGIKNLKDEISDGVIKKHPMNEGQLLDRMQVVAKESYSRRNKNLFCEINRKTINKAMLDNHISLKNAQIKPNAREAAEKDPSNAVSTYFLFQYGMKYVKNNYLVLNYDACQVVIDDNNITYTKVAVNTDEVLDTGPLNINTSSTNFPYCIKYMCVCSLNGQLCPYPVFLMADNSLGKDEFYWYKIPQMSFEISLNGYGYICFCKTRCGNAKFFKWFNTEVLIPYIALLREVSDAGDEDTVFIMCDGEAIQIYQYFDKEIKKLLDELHIMIGKLCASTTAASQACDAYKMFCLLHYNATKRLIDDVNSKTTLKNNLIAAFKTHMKYTTSSFDTTTRNRAVNALIRVVIAIQKSMTQELIRDSFRTVGINTDLTVNLDQIMHQYNINLSENELANLTYDIPAGIRFFEKEGRMTDAQLLKYDVVKNRTEYNSTIMAKDEKVIYQERCVVVSNNSAQKRYNDRILAKAEDIKKREERKKLRNDKKTNKKELENNNNNNNSNNSNSKRKKTENNELSLGIDETLPKNMKKTKKSATQYDVDFTKWVQCEKKKCLGASWYTYDELHVDDDWIPPDLWYCPACLI